MTVYRIDFMNFESLTRSKKSASSRTTFVKPRLATCHHSKMASIPVAACTPQKNRQSTPRFALLSATRCLIQSR